LINVFRLYQRPVDKSRENPLYDAKYAKLYIEIRVICHGDKGASGDPAETGNP